MLKKDPTEKNAENHLYWSTDKVFKNIFKFEKNLEGTIGKANHTKKHAGTTPLTIGY